MISAFANTWKIPELRDRILFTLALIVIIRLGVHITIPGVDATVIKDWLDSLKNQDPTTGGGITALLTVFSGGGLQQAGIFALGIMPYISASIMVQLMTAVVPKLSRLAREDGGRQKITQYTRYITIVIALVQGFFVAKSLTNPGNIPYMNGIERFGNPFILGKMGEESTSSQRAAFLEDLVQMTFDSVGVAVARSAPTAVTKTSTAPAVGLKWTTRTRA